jgi:hypothetical protein
MPVTWQNAFQSAACRPRFITSWYGPPCASHLFRQMRTLSDEIAALSQSAMVS